MRRQATMGLAFALPFAFSVWASAQTRGAAQPAGAAAPAASTPAAGAASPGAAPAGAASAAASPGAGGAPTAAGASAGAGTPSSTAPAAGMDGATYAVRLRDLESRVDELKDQIRRSHTRLSLLSDTILAGGIAGARSEVTFQNQMSNAFRLVKAVFVLDGTVQYNKSDESGVLAEQKEIPIFNGPVAPGDHTVQAQLTFQGHGYGVFTYLRGYRFDVKSSHSFTITEGKTMSVTGVAVERGDLTTPLEQRPAVEWRERVGTLGVAPGNVAAPAAGAPRPGASSGAPAGGATGSVQTAPAPAGSVGGSVGGGVSIGGGAK